MNRKRILSFIMVMVMVFAMAATACGKKEEAAEKEEPKQEEASVEEDRQAADDQTDAKEEESLEVESDAGLTDEKIAELYSAIKSAVENEYLEPNNISPSEFKWPAYELNSNGVRVSDEDFLWTYFTTIYDNYTLFGKLYDTTDFPVGVPIPEKKELMDAVLTGVREWYEVNNSIEPYEINEKLGDLAIAISENVKFDE